MSIQAKRELLAQTAPRYRAATPRQKGAILDEFVAATGYARKYAIRLLGQPRVPPPAPITRSRARTYGPEVVAALTVAWAAANYVCAKRFVPFLPELVASLERHGHLALSPQVRTQLLTLSPATADRLLRPLRERTRPRGIGTTKAGTLLKHKAPIRTFAEWDDIRPGFLEADAVAHCGTRAEGPYLSSLVLTDVATGWTECLPLLHHGYADVLRALDQVRDLLPFPLLGLDTDNGSEFLNYPLLEYCEQATITFTRGRAYRKNDQCYVEQKNGSIVRQIVGYDRFEGELAYHQLAELYRALRLYVNFFQPSLKLELKRRAGSQVYRRYDTAQTPCQRLLAAGVLDDATCARLVALAEGLDPVQLLHQLRRLQEALWRHAVTLVPATPAPTVPFILPAAASVSTAAEHNAAVSLRARLSSAPPKRPTQRGAQPRTTRPDPCAAEAGTSDGWLTAQSEQLTAERSADGIRKERRQRCKDCGEPFRVFSLGRERTSAYCDGCGEERRRVQARIRMQALRARHRSGAGRGSRWNRDGVDAVAAEPVLCIARISYRPGRRVASRSIGGYDIAHISYTCDRTRPRRRACPAYPTPVT